MIALVNDIKVIKLPFFPEKDASLVVIEGQQHAPFAIARVFSVKGQAGVTRGRHAHKACTQFLICLNGCVEVRCDDGHAIVSHVLQQADQGLLIPPGIWAECMYKSSDSVLMVLCDRVYESDDYIRDYNEFKLYRKV